MNRFSFVVFSFILFHSAFCQMDSISSIDKSFLNKETVKVLNLNGCLDLILSDEIAELNNLEDLNVSGTNLEVFPKSITKCKKLKKVNLNYNPSININQVCKAPCFISFFHLQH